MIIKKYYKSGLSFLLILFLSFLPGNEANKVKFIDFPHIDKFIHFFMYFIFSLALFSDLKTGLTLQKKQLFLIIFFSVVVTGFLTELIQKYFIPMRSGDFFDFIADLYGYFIFLVIVIFQENKNDTVI